jgi:type 1 glutamine amidotransferase
MRIHHFRKCLTLVVALFLVSNILQAKPIRVLVITGGHAYKAEPFNQMLDGLGKGITCQVVSFPDAYSSFLPENRQQYDVLVFYHMWQKITEDQAKTFADCIRDGKPIVVLHHSICAFDDWPEYINIIGGKYFHKPTIVNGKEYAVCTYKHGLTIPIKVVDPKHPVTKGVTDFELFDEAYHGYYVSPEATPLLTTDEPNSSPILGWTKKYGKAQVVTIQSGHDTPTFENPVFRKLLKQSIEWVYKQSK